LETLGHIKNELRRWLEGAGKVVIVGVGSPLRRDDSAGLAVVRELEMLGASDIEGVELLEAGSAPANILGKLDSLGPSHIILIDAADHGSRPGSVRLVRPEEARSGHIITTHTLPLGFLCSYVEREAGARTIIIGIQPKDLGLGEGLSPEVERASRSLARALYEVLLAVKRGRHI